MTAQRRDGQETTPFHAWVRGHPGLDSVRECTKALREQRSAGAFITGHQQNVRRVYSVIAGKIVQVHCYGVHKLRMSGASPEISQWMTWSDGHGQEQYITCEQLVQLFRFDISPDTLRPLEHREHKRRIEPPASLFDEGAKS